MWDMCCQDIIGTYDLKVQFTVPASETAAPAPMRGSDVMAALANYIAGACESGRQTGGTCQPSQQ